MRQLLLLRHAKSSWEDRSLSDHERPLNARGREAAALMRGVVESLGLVPDMVLVSTAVRTRQTLDALEPWPETPLIEPMDNLYLATAAQMLKVLQGVPETVRSLMLVGHNPGLHELAVRLVGAHAMTYAHSDLRRLSESYPSGALAEFSVAGPWHGIGEGGGRLVRFICPRDLQATAD